MNSIIEFISNNETIIMISLFVLIIVLTAIVLITDFINRRKIKKYTMSLFEDPNVDVEDAFNEPIIEEPTLEYTQDLGVIENIPSTVQVQPLIEEIKYVEEDEELEKTKAQLELKNLKEELIRADIEEKEKQKNNVESLETSEILNPIDEFEQAQEDNAIISLDQFNLVGNKIYENNELIQYKDEGNEPISIKELEKLYNTKEITKITDEEIINVDEPIQQNDEMKFESTNENANISNNTQKFKNSPIISPVYGIDNTESVDSIALENTANLEKLNEEIRKTNEFLLALKELRKTLD